MLVGKFKDFLNHHHDDGVVHVEADGTVKVTRNDGSVHTAPDPVRVNLPPPEPPKE